MSPRWLHWPAASSGPDWDTAATVLHTVYGVGGSGGVATVTYENGSLFTNNLNSGTPVASTIARTNTTSRSGIALSGGTVDTNGILVDAPFSATWVNGSGWVVGSPLGYGVYKVFVFSECSPTVLASDFTVGCAVIFYASDPGDPTSWRDYDGPTS
jgi:hypothetical protein